VEKINFENRLSKLFFLVNAGAHSKRDVMRGHVGAPPYVSYPRRARTPRRRSDQRLLRCVGVNSPVTFVASGPCQVAPIHRTGAPLAAGAMHVAGHVVAFPRVLVSPA
jgi:hypothetical protein